MHLKSPNTGLDLNRIFNIETKTNFIRPPERNKSEFCGRIMDTFCSRNLCLTVVIMQLIRFNCLIYDLSNLYSSSNDEEDTYSAIAHLLEAEG